MTLRLRGQVAVLTGGGGGIGRDVALRFAKEGAFLAVLDNDAGSAHETVRQVEATGGAAVAVECDVSSEDDVIRALDATVDRYAGLDILINNAGIGAVGACAETSLEDWNRVLAVNLTGPFLCSKHAIPRMLAGDGGVIVNVAAIAALVGVKERTAYAASKAGMLGLTRAITYDYSRRGIRCNAVCPATVMTPMVVTAQEQADDPMAFLRQVTERQFVGRMATLEEISAAIAFLASSDSGYMYGACLPLDGGVTATSPPISVQLGESHVSATV